jgi:MFS family permease
MERLTRPLRAALAALREAMSNDGIRRLEIAWMLGLAADTALLVVLLVVVFEREGIVATGLLGAIRMAPAVAAGMLSGALLDRFRGDRLLVALAVTRTASAALCAFVIATDGPTPALFALAAIAAAAGAPVRPTQATLMPALARSPSELVAANMAWSTGEGIGGLAGPFVAGVLIAAGRESAVAAVVAVAFGITAVVVAGLQFEQAEDASGSGRSEAGAGGLRLLDGLRTLRRRPVPGWSMLGVFGQVMTRGLLNALVVIASIELLEMGNAGVGVLNGALGLGGFLGAALVMSVTRTDQLVRSMCLTLAFWGAPIAVIGLLPHSGVAIVAMSVIGVANAAYDVIVFTIYQRGCTNEERGPVFSVFEGIAGLGMVSGSLLAPVLVTTFGTQAALGIAGAILPIIALIIYSRIGRADRISVVNEETVQLLRQVPAFVELPLTAIERLAAGLIPVRYASGDTLLREGVVGDEFIVVDSGEVDVFVGGQRIQRLGHGAGVGEISLIRKAPRTATVVAVSDVEGYSIPCTYFLAAIAGPAAAAVTNRIAEAHLARARGGA